jgi:hypothetical protein
LNPEELEANGEHSFDDAALVQEDLRIRLDPATSPRMIIFSFNGSTRGLKRLQIEP